MTDTRRSRTRPPVARRRRTQRRIQRPRAADGIDARLTHTRVDSQLLHGEGEKPLTVITRHWWVYVRPTLVGLVGLAFFALALTVPADLSLLPVLVSFVLLGRSGWVVVREYRDWFVITNIRVFRVHGMFGSSVSTMPLARIQDISLEKPALGRLLGFGHFVFESAAQTQGVREIRFVPHPDERNRQILELVHRPALRDARHG